MEVGKIKGFYIESIANKGEADNPKPHMASPKVPTLRALFVVLCIISPLTLSYKYWGYYFMVANIPPKESTIPPMAHPIGLTKGNPEAMAI